MASAFTKTIPASLKEIRMLLCQTSEASAGARKFIASQYPSIKSSHPDLKFMVREAQGIEARAIARFERGAESQVSLEGLAEKDVASRLNELVKEQK